MLIECSVTALYTCYTTHKDRTVQTVCRYRVSGAGASPGGTHPSEDKVAEVQVLPGRTSLHLHHTAVLVPLAQGGATPLRSPQSCGAGHHLCLAGTTAGGLNLNVLNDYLQGGLCIITPEQ